jgi:HSP20 family protein
MTLVKWDPFRDVAELQNRINRMFDESFAGSRSPGDEVALRTWRPAVDIYETESGIVIDVELPGVSKEAVAVEVKDDVLTLKGERTANPHIKEDNYYRRERLYGPFKRSFTLHHNIQPALIKATFKDGILQIEIPRPMEEQPKQITVNVE